MLFNVKIVGSTEHIDSGNYDIAIRSYVVNIDSSAADAATEGGNNFRKDMGENYSIVEVNVKRMRN